MAHQSKGSRIQTVRLDANRKGSKEPGDGDSDVDTGNDFVEQEPDDPGASASSIEMVVEMEIGRLINDRYRITEVIGEGGMGVVYQADDLHLDRKVAIKLMRADCVTNKKFLTRFKREMEVTSQLRHPSTVRVFEHGTGQDGRPYMVMELLTGESLADRLERGRIEEMEALQYARQIAESLSEAHQHGVFHRDLKPENVFIELVGMSTVVKVLDFGIAGGADAARLTQAGEVFGTPQYMSPEQCNGLPLDPRTDVYSLGVILYEMVEGRPPFSADSPMATMLKHVRAKPPRVRYGSAHTAKVIAAALRKDRGRRIQSAAKFAVAIGESMGAIRDGVRAEPGSIGGIPAPVLSGSQGAVSAPIVVHDDDDSRGRTIAFVLGGLALGLVAIMLFGGVGSVAEPATETPEEPDAPAAPNAADEGLSDAAAPLPNNRALVSTNIEGAKVLVDGNEQCSTPCEIKVPVGDGEVHEIRLVKEGYIDVIYNWEPKGVGEPLPPLPDMKPL